MEHPKYTNKEVDVYLSKKRLQWLDWDDDMNCFNGINSTLHALTKKINDSFYLSDNHKLDYCLLEDASINASARVFESDDEKTIDLVSIHAGTFYSALELFKHLVFAEDTLIDVGGIEQEGRGFKNEDIDKLDYAYGLAVLVTSYVYLHEVGHLVWGHIEYLRDFKPENRLLQVLENQADIFAIDDLLETGAKTIIAKRLLGDQLQPGDERKTIALDNLWGTGDRMIWNTIYAISAMVIRMSANSEELIQLDSTHPTQYIRANSLLVSALTFIRGRPIFGVNGKSDDVLQFIMSACLTAENDMKKIGYKDGFFNPEDEKLYDYLLEGAKMKISVEGELEKNWRNPKMANYEKLLS